MGVMNADWLTQLAPAHAPPAPGWWPPAPGWWGLALLIALAAIALLYWFRRPAGRRRRAALRELGRLQGMDDIRLAAALENLLRRYALAAYGRETVAALSGEAWLAFLANHGGGALAGETGRALLQAAYGGAATVHRDHWLQGVRGFLRQRA